MSGRAGFQLRVRPALTQPRTVAQTNARALTGALAGLWRQLTSSQQTAWDQAATAPRTGYSLFVACNRRLATVNIATPLTEPVHAPAFPQLLGFNVQPQYDNPLTPTSITALTASTFAPLDSAFAIVLRATPALSPARGHIGPNALRIIYAGTPWATSSYNALARWLGTFGTIPFAGTISFTLEYVDPLSGHASPQVLSAAPYSFAGPTPPPPGAITIAVDGTGVATITGGAVYVDGTLVAG